MRALKILVIGMGALIVLGFAVVAATLAVRIFSAGEQGAGPVAERTVTLPAGAELVDMATTDDRIVIRLRLADGGTRLLLLDPRTGAPVGDVHFSVPLD